MDEIVDGIDKHFEDEIERRRDKSIPLPPPMSEA